MIEQTSAGSAGLAPGTWLIESQAGRIGFKVKTMWGLVDVKGTFDRFDGQLRVTEGSVKGELVVHTDSLDTKNKQRDKHLRSADFFDAKSHPSVIFTATDVTRSSGGVTFSGDITLGDTRTHVDIPAFIEPAGETDAVTVRASAEIPREDLGLVWNKMGMIKGHARLDIELRLNRSH